MEVRGGNGEDCPNARLVRDAHLGLIWEGTSNINALDAIQRAIGKAGSHVAFRDAMAQTLTAAPHIPGQFRTRLENAVTEAVAFAREVATHKEYERFCRVAAAKLYHAMTATLLAAEGARLGMAGGDARRLVIARFVLNHRLREARSPQLGASDWEDGAIGALLSECPMTIDQAINFVQQ